MVSQQKEQNLNIHRNAGRKRASTCFAARGSVLPSAASSGVTGKDQVKIALLVKMLTRCNRIGQPRARFDTNRMSKHFNYYDVWQSVELECPICHWKGKFNEGSVKYYRELQDCSCPKCDSFVSPILAIVSYPTLDEMLASGNPADIQQAKKREQFRQNFDSRKLASKEQIAGGGLDVVHIGLGLS
jgi:hypothetical protein